MLIEVEKGLVVPQSKGDFRLIEAASRTAYTISLASGIWYDLDSVLELLKATKECS